MGNFDPLFAEVAARRQNRWALNALAFNWGLLLLMVGALPYFPS